MSGSGRAERTCSSRDLGCLGLRAQPATALDLSAEFVMPDGVAWVLVSSVGEAAEAGPAFL